MSAGARSRCSPSASRCSPTPRHARAIWTRPRRWLPASVPRSALAGHVDKISYAEAQAELARAVAQLKLDREAAHA